MALVDGARGVSCRGGPDPSVGGYQHAGFGCTGRRSLRLIADLLSPSPARRLRNRRRARRGLATNRHLCRLALQVLLLLPEGIEMLARPEQVEPCSYLAPILADRIAYAIGWRRPSTSGVCGAG